MKTPKLPKKEWDAKRRRLNFLGYKALGGTRTFEEEAEAKKLLKELWPEPET